MSLILNALQKARKLAGGGAPQKAPAYLKSFGFSKEAKPAPKSKVRKILLSYVVPIFVLGSIIAGGVVYYINRTATSPMAANAQFLDDIELPLADDSAPADDALVDGSVADEAISQIDPATAEVLAAAAAESGPDAAETEGETPPESPTPDSVAATDDRSANLSFGNEDDGPDEPTENTPVDALSDGPDVAPAEDSSVAGRTGPTGGEAAAEGAEPPPAASATERPTAPEPEPVPATATLTRAINDPFDLAVFYQRSGQYLLALEHYNAVLAENPMHAEALVNRGVIQMNTGDLVGARDSFRTATLADPNYDTPYNNLGLLQMNEGKNGEAARSFQRALALNSRNADAMTNLAIVTQREGDYSQAIVYYLQALQIDPAKAEAHYGIAFLYESEGESGKAVDHLDQFLRLGSDQYPDLVSEVEAKIRELSGTDQ